jgi:hypothetical protein
MKMMKTALLATAAIAAVTTSARANELSDLKAQIEALNARISQVEAAPAVPAGYQLVSITKGEALKFGLDSDINGPATLISVLPAADAPAGTVVSISGNVAAALVYSQVDDIGNGPLDNSFDVDAKAGLTVAGVTDTAVGEVGAKMSLEFTYDQDITGTHAVGADGFWGYWEFAEGMRIGGGRDGSLATIGYGIESNTSRIFTGAHSTNQGAGGDPAQLRLSYGSGPIAFAVAIEDATRNAAGSLGDDDALGASAELKYTSDMVSVEIAGGAWNDDDAISAGNDSEKWSAGIGAGINVVDGVAVHVGAQVGEFFNGRKIRSVSASTKLSLSDAIRFEVGAGWEKIGVVKTKAVVAGIYYSPVSQLTLGLEADWFSESGNTNDGTTVALVTKYSF